MNNWYEEMVQMERRDMDKEGRDNKVKYRPLLDYDRVYLFRERGTLNYIEGKVLKYGGLDILGDGGEERFELVKLKIDGKGIWWKREELIPQIQVPSDHEDGY
jgi:hypothetical protein